MSPRLPVIHLSLAAVLVVVFLTGTDSAAYAVSERRPVLPPTSFSFLEKGQVETFLLYEHEESSTARNGSGQLAPNPEGVSVNLNTVHVSLRYGVSRRLNLVTTVPFYSIVSSTARPLPLERKNRGFGDPLVVVEYSPLSSSRLILLGGLRLPLSDTDHVDDLGQPFADVLALGTETVDIILGGRAWLRTPGPHRMAVSAEVRHRFSGGASKWGYRFGDETSFSLWAAHPFSDSARLGLRIQGCQIQQSVWHGNQVGDTGATMLEAGPTVFWDVRPGVTVGGFAHFPVVMHLEGTQMVSRARLGLAVTTDIEAVANQVLGRDERQGN